MSNLNDDTKPLKSILEPDENPNEVYCKEIQDIDISTANLECLKESNLKEIQEKDKIISDLSLKAQKEISLVEIMEQKQVSEKEKEYNHKLDAEKIRFESELEEILIKWKKANIFIKIIKLPFYFKYAKEEENCRNEFENTTFPIKEKMKNEIEQLKKRFSNEKEQIKNKGETEIRYFLNERKKYSDKITEIDCSLDINKRTKQFITNGDLSLTKNIIALCKSYIDHKQYPMKNRVKELDDYVKNQLDNLNKNYSSILQEYKNYILDLEKIYRSNALKDILGLKENYIKIELENNSKLFDDIDGKKLDTQQRIAVVTDEQNNLVIAGAGSGKTLTIAAKVKYLVDVKHVDPADILLVTYTKKAAQEMEERITQKLGINVKVKTFHSLGYGILQYFNSEKPGVMDETDLSKFNNKFKTEIVPMDMDLSSKIIMYFGTYMTDYVDPDKFKTLGEYFGHYKHFLSSILNIISKLKSKNLKIDIDDKITALKDKLFSDLDEENIKKVLIEAKEIVLNMGYSIKNSNLGSTFDLNKIVEDIDKALNMQNNQEDRTPQDTKAMQEEVNSILDDIFTNKITFKDERVKSIEELIIANFLYINGVKYEYEKEYKYPTADKYHRQYKPDFYLPDYDIYLEHFGVNENGRCPQYSEKEEKLYIEGMNWKRELHHSHGTVMEETYSYYHKQGILIDKLKEILKKHNIKTVPLTKEQIIDTIRQLNSDDGFSDFYKLLSTFMGLFKSNGYTKDKIDSFIEVAKCNTNPDQRDKHVAFLEIFKRYYDEYTAELSRLHKIDFNDMINESTSYIKASELPRDMRFRYIIIDEFQDISVSRFRLIDALRKQSNAKIISVGDDWQSIYRFAGSDISIFTKFSEYFGETEVLKIEKTYRNSQQLIDVASTFITKNPDQIKKELKSDKSTEKPISLVWYKQVYDKNELETNNDSLVRKLVFILEKMDRNVKKNILLLGRNGNDLKNNLKGTTLFHITTINGETIIKSDLFPNFNIKFLTIHKSKGLEADEVIILNNSNSTTGFPNKIASDSVLKYVMTKEEEYLYAEERRLFYVAITRTKNHTYLMVPDDHSSFIEELCSETAPMEYKENIEFIRSSNSELIRCPRCETGHLVMKINRTSGEKFYSCSNNPQCTFTITDLDAVKKQIRCPRCGGIMIKKHGPNGDFYGCTNYQNEVKCKFTLSVAEYNEQLDRYNKEKKDDIDD